MGLAAGTLVAGLPRRPRRWLLCDRSAAVPSNRPAGLGRAAAKMLCCEEASESAPPPVVADASVGRVLKEPPPALVSVVRGLRRLRRPRLLLLLRRGMEEELCARGRGWQQTASASSSPRHQQHCVCSTYGAVEERLALVDVAIEAPSAMAE